MVTNLRVERQRAGYLLQEVAQLCDLDTSNFSKAERLQRPVPEAARETLQRIFGRPINELLRPA